MRFQNGSNFQKIFGTRYQTRILKTALIKQGPLGKDAENCGKSYAKLDQRKLKIRYRTPLRNQSIRSRYVSAFETKGNSVCFQWLPYQIYNAYTVRSFTNTQSRRAICTRSLEPVTSCTARHVLASCSSVTNTGPDIHLQAVSTH